jgi:hypothetical protein
MLLHESNLMRVPAPLSHRHRERGTWNMVCALFQDESVPAVL